MANETKDDFIPSYPGETAERRAYEMEFERRYLEDTRFQDGPTEVTEWPPKVMKGY